MTRQEEAFESSTNGVDTSKPRVPHLCISLYPLRTLRQPRREKVDACGGWHDAGDYGRYSSAAAVALGHLLYAYELFPESFSETINIPESGNGIPDILNECLYELNWLLKMQRKDGGVYHKVTAFRHAEFIMPQEDSDPFMFFPVSSFATADFVAVMALASRVYKPFLPDRAACFFDAAIKGTEWLSRNAFTPFKNPEGCNTGLYADDSDTDERLWAACEMLRIDNAHREDYVKVITDLTHDYVSKADFGWEDVSGLASMSILTDPEHRSGMLEAKCKNNVLTIASRLIETSKGSAYRLAMEADDFVWGSNMVVLNRAMLFILSSMITDSPVSDKYIAAATEHLHYILGRNPMDISYVTGHGENAFKNPHGRVTALVGGLPMPGWVSGGPFKNFMDPSALAAIPKGTAPMKCYVDEVGSYSTNEITIYWNSPFVFLCAFLNSFECR